MGSEIVIIPIVFGVIFGIFYLFISARNKERLALIEKGADASIFYSKDKSIVPAWKVIVINLALLLMGIGVGIFLGGFFTDIVGMDDDIAMPGTILFMAGLGLLTGFYMTKKLTESN
ncbi:MAG: DUF6249 domain-containing protein [Flavobacteriaceae bacterium]